MYPSQFAVVMLSWRAYCVALRTPHGTRHSVAGEPGNDSGSVVVRRRVTVGGTTCCGYHRREVM